MEKNNSSYNQIIKSTTIFGGSQVITVIIGIIRTKVVAVLLGPTGVGIIGIYQSIIDMIRFISGLGIETSAIKEIAITDTGNTHRTISIFNRWFIATAALGLFVCILFSYPISLWTFEDSSFALPVASLSICVFLVTLAIGKSVALQGMRKIAYMAQAGIWGSIIGLITTIPLYYVFGLKGIIPAFITGSLVLYFCTDFYYRKLNVTPVKVTNDEVMKAGLSTLKLGGFIIMASIVNTASMFLVRTFLAREMSIDGAGLFQSAWSITNVYLGLILKSMGTDFFPRLSAIIGDKDKVKKLVNEQSYIVLVVASPIIIGMLLFSDFALSVLYSSKFTDADTLLQWQIVGTFFKVITWPLAFIMLAKNKGAMFLLSEVLFYAVYLISAYFLYPQYGLNATGIGYLIAYLVYLPAIFIISRSIADFNWSSNIVKMIFINLVLIICAFCITQYLAGYTLILGGILLIISLIYSYVKLRIVFSWNDLKGWFKKK